MIVVFKRDEQAPTIQLTASRIVYDRFRGLLESAKASVKQRSARPIQVKAEFRQECAQLCICCRLYSYTRRAFLGAALRPACAISYLSHEIKALAPLSWLVDRGCTAKCAERVTISGEGRRTSRPWRK